MGYPEDLKYTKDHEWVKVEGSSALVGITQFAQAELGDVVFVELPAVGKTIKQGDTLCVVESTKAASDVYSPIGGTVKEVNSKLTTAPESINKEPFGSGWMVRLENVSSSDVATLLSASQYKELIGEK